MAEKSKNIRRMKSFLWTTAEKARKQKNEHIKSSCIMHNDNFLTDLFKQWNGDISTGTSETISC